MQSLTRPRWARTGVGSSIARCGLPTTLNYDRVRTPNRRLRASAVDSRRLWRASRARRPHPPRYHRHASLGSRGLHGRRRRDAQPRSSGRAGTVFTEAITAAPITLPAHSSILSGLYPTSHGTRFNGIFRLPDEVETVAETLKGAGFATGAFVGAFVLDRRFGLEQGFDVYDDELPRRDPVQPRRISPSAAPRKS